MVETHYLQSIIKKTNDWLGNEGKKFFTQVLLKENDLIAVHFQEGMKVRNFLRTLKECESWDDHDFDNNWRHIIKKCLMLKEKK
jgi:hypothetical protein